MIKMLYNSFFIVRRLNSPEVDHGLSPLEEGYDATSRITINSCLIMKMRILAVLLALIGTTPFSISRAQSDISLTGYTLTFDDEFNSLSVSTASPKGLSNWYAYPPNGPTGNFSESQFDPTALGVSNGILSERAFLDSSNSWHSGYISSVDTTKAGFSQQYGYFEIRAKMPASSTGAWPAFWLDSTNGITDGANEEIDIFEWYGVSYSSVPGLVQQASHSWNPDGSQAAGGLYSPETQMPDGSQPWVGYHIYGCQVDPVHITWYIDGVQTNQIATPTSYVTSPFYIMVDYAIGGGWPLSGMVNNSSLNVDWVRVYSLPTGSGSGSGSTTSTNDTNAIGMQFQGLGTALLSTDSAGVSSVAQTNWNVLTGSTFSSHALSDSTGASTSATITGWSNGTWFGGGSSAAPTGNAKLASGELFNGWPGPPSLTISNIPYAKYDVYVYVGMDAAGRNETCSLTPSGGTAQSYSFTTEGGNSTWTAATSTWDGTGTAPTLPSANYVHFTGLTASSFSMVWGAPGNGGLNGIQIVPTGTGSGTGTGTGTGSGSSTGTAPAITAQPANQTVPVGQAATFSVTATGTASLSYQWEKNSNAISGATSATYTTPATTTGDDGSTFSVVITNSYGSVTSNSATLSVTGTAPTITAQPASQSVSVGQAATFSVTATGTASLSYQWQKNSTAISGATSATYTTPATTAGDNGATFSVVITNSYGSATSKGATLTVTGTTPISGSGSAGIGMQFQGLGTALLSTDSAGVSSVAQTNWNVLSGSYFGSHTLSDSSGASTTATLSGYSNGTFWGGGSSVAPTGNAKLASGELFNGWPGPPTLTVSNIPYAKYDVYVYAGIDAAGRIETCSLTPSNGATQSYSFTTENGNSTWTAATSTWDGNGTAPALPSANYVHFTGLTGSSFTMLWGAPGNGGLNGIQIVPTQ